MMARVCYINLNLHVIKSAAPNSERLLKCAATLAIKCTCSDVIVVLRLTKWRKLLKNRLIVTYNLNFGLLKYGFCYKSFRKNEPLTS